MQDRGIDLVGVGHFIAIDPGQVLPVVEERVADPRPRGSVHVVEAIVRAMIAQRGGGDRRAVGYAVEVTVGELRERFIGARRGGRDRVDDRESGNNQGLVHDHPPMRLPGLALAFARDQFVNDVRDRVVASGFLAARAVFAIDDDGGNALDAVTAAEIFGNA